MRTNEPAGLPVPADPERHTRPIARLTADIFAGGQYVDDISRQYIGNSHYDWATSRLIFAGERLVHHWGVWGYPMRLGPARLRVAGVGAVATVEAHRRQGLMAQAAESSLAAMRDHGYDLSILRGRHYVKFGYVRAWHYVTYRVEPTELGPLPDPPAHRPLGPDDMDAIIALYNQSHEPFSGTAVRPTYRMLNQGDMSVYGWFDAAGGLAGYVRAVPEDDKKSLQCLEAAGDVGSGLAVLNQMREDRSLASLSFFTLPHQHPVLRRLRRGACLVETRLFAGTGWRVRLVDLESTLSKLLPLLEERLRRSHLAGWKGHLHLDGGAQSATLALDGGKIQFALPLPTGHNIHAGPALARLLIGSDEPGEVMQQEGIKTTGRGAELARVLFPNMRPMMSHWDEY
jgi:hypothetical protein